MADSQAVLSLPNGSELEENIQKSHKIIKQMAIKAITHYPQHHLNGKDASAGYAGSSGLGCGL